MPVASRRYLHEGVASWKYAEIASRRFTRSIRANQSNERARIDKIRPEREDVSGGVAGRADSTGQDDDSAMI